MSELLQRIADLERRVRSLRQANYELRRSREMWRVRAMESERNQSRRRRFAA